MKTREARKARPASRRHEALPARSNRNGTDDLCRRLRDEVGEERFDRYFGGGTRLRSAPGRIEVVVPSPFLAELIDRRFSTSIRRAASAETAEGDVAVHIRVERDIATARAAEPAREAAPPPAAPRRSPPRILTRLRYRLDGFVVGDSNRVAYSAAARIADGTADGSLGLLLLHGGSGLGKTHLLQGVAARFAEREPRASVRYVTAEAFTNEYISAVRSNSLEKFRRAWRSVRLLCLDDVHFVAGKEGTQQELLHTLEAIGLDNARIVLASDEHPRQIRDLGDRLISRLLAGAVIRVDPPDAPMRSRLIAELAKRRQLTLSHEALEVLLQRAAAIPSCSVRDLEGLLNQIEAVRRLAPDVCPEAGELDAADVRRSLGLSEGAQAGRRAREARRPIRLDLIVEHVCRTLRVDRSELLGSGRHKRVVLARRLVVKLARDLTTLSFPDIGRGLNRPSHSTVVTAHQKVCALIASESPVRIGPDLDGQTVGELALRVREIVLRSAGR